MAHPVHLDNIEAFRAALHDYKMSAHAQKVLAASRLALLSGLAGGGRNTVINYLVKEHDYNFLISDTTRPPKLRDGVMEQNGVNYHFRVETDMLRDIQMGEFVEAEIIHNQQVSGTSIRELELANQKGKITIHETEFGGAHYIAMAKPDVHIIGLLPPSYDEWMRRLQAREDMHPDEFINRLTTAQTVLQNMLAEPYYKLVINNTIPQCASDIRDIVEFNQIHDERQQFAKSVANDMLARVQASLQHK
ncbi:MAG TPA: hypothetical protein VF575_04300 [Candidatus Saccharimonadales bacterium]|jgi:guanylate kinase